MVSQKSDLTFKYNLKQGRHGWLRLTPAYSIKVVQNLLDRLENPQRVLDPFSGTGTTGLVCAERGLNCDLVEVNPFLVWLAEAKTHAYNSAELEAASKLVKKVAKQARQNPLTNNLWIPPLSNIERWWHRERLITLANLFNGLDSYKEKVGDTPSFKLAAIAFCKVAINWSNAAFNHQSMSFKDTETLLFKWEETDLIIDDFLFQSQEFIASARTPILSKVSFYQGDSRNVNTKLSQNYDVVITSPPYVNRMSYIREVRPYMYWLGFLKEAREAGELDWQAIGGTWGIATSRLKNWQPEEGQICEGLEDITQTINKRSPILANYVRRYFSDISTHISNLTKVLAPGAEIFYIVGNSKFYDTLVPVEQIYMKLLKQRGFKNVKSEVLRKRNSKKELYEYIISAEWE
ncbi:MAG: hypothetical protein SXA11_25485 [Cyanobacteriota bacterium]|nr:hypothetical protein [Cyanobacteriota bacterium]